VVKKTAKKTAKKVTKKVTKKNKCGSCGELGHNARVCDQKAGDVPTTGAMEELTKEREPQAPLAPEEAFDFDSLALASTLEGASKPAGADCAPGETPPGAKLKIPKRKKGRTKAQDSFWAATKKAMAPDSLAEAGELVLDIPRLSSGNFGLDVALFGGIPQGRFVRITGAPKSAKTGTCLNTVAEYMANHCSECFQRECDCKNRDVPEVLWIDIEHRLDSMLRWVQAHGVNLDCLRVLGPPTGQDVIDMVDHIIRSAPQAKIGLIVIDSIAHITSQDEIKKATKKGPTVGRNAMLMNSGWRKWTSAFHSLGINNARKPTILCINQEREKVGVTYGCFHEDTPVMFADGNQLPIREVVERRLSGPVLSWNGSEIVEREITGWHENGVLLPDEDWLTFRMTGTGGRRGAMGFTCTPNHVLVTGDGKEVPAASVRVGDQLLSWYEAGLSRSEREIVMGSLLGDGGLDRPHGNDNVCSFALTNNEQLDYLDWKLKQLRTLGFTSTKIMSGLTYRSTSSFELGLLRKQFYRFREDGSEYRTLPPDVVASASPLTLAVWYMDDGCFKALHNNATICAKRLSQEEGDVVAKILADRFKADRSAMSGRKTRCEAPSSVYFKHGLIHFTSAAFHSFSAYICEFVHPSLAYKLIPDHRAVARGASLPPPDPMRRTPIPVEVVKIHKSKRKMRTKRKYDLAIADDSFYLVGGDSRGVVVHNSPITEPGGKGQGYASTVDLRFTSGPPNFMVWKPAKEAEKKKDPTFEGVWEVKQKGYNSTFKPGQDQTPDFATINYIVKASGHCPAGRNGDFNYWLKSAHGRRCGDVDNALQLWTYAKRYDLIESDGGMKKLFGHEAKTYDALETAFRADPRAQRKAWVKLMGMLLK